MGTFLRFPALENVFKTAILFLISNHRQKSEKDTILIHLQYHCRTMAEKN